MIRVGVLGGKVRVRVMGKLRGSVQLEVPIKWGRAVGLGEVLG